MSDAPQYRRRLQELTDLLLSSLPAGWQEATLRAAFPSNVRTRLDVSFRSSPQGGQVPVEIPTALTHDFAGVARAVRAELVSEGNPECKGFVYRLARSGAAAIDVEY
jgi:hypothetical protein